MAFLAVADPMDQAISQWLRLHSVPGFARFMDQSLFEGKGFGAGDFAIFIQIAVLGLWLGSFYSKASERLRRQRSLLGYILASSILTALCVHLSKGLIGRPRPYELGLATSSWNELTQRLLQGWGHGSFPSGHTANAISLIALAYAARGLGHKRSAWALGLAFLLFALSMGISRVMMGAHWPSDAIAAIGLGWFIAHSRFRTWQKRMENAA